MNKPLENFDKIIITKLDVNFLQKRLPTITVEPQMKHWQRWHPDTIAKTMHFCLCGLILGGLNLMCSPGSHILWKQLISSIENSSYRIQGQDIGVESVFVLLWDCIRRTNLNQLSF